MLQDGTMSQGTERCLGYADPSNLHSPRALFLELVEVVMSKK